MVRKKKWECNVCGELTDDPDKVCLTCRTDTTVVRGFVDKKDVGK